MPVLPLVIFIAVYAGMATGGLPRLRVDRAWIALAGAAALIFTGVMSVETAAETIDAGALVLLFALMVVSAQFAHSGFYERCAAEVVRLGRRPEVLLAAVVALAGGLSAVLVNDIVAFALTPMLCLGARARGLNPKPYLLALAASANAGSAASLIGNPQNILIGQVGDLHFWTFVAVCAPVALAALGITFGVIWWLWRDRLVDADGVVGAPIVKVADLDRPALIKAVVATVLLLILFATPIPREASALLVAVALMISRKVESRDLIGRVDFNLLLLFAGLFVVTGAFSLSGWSETTGVWLAGAGLDAERLGPLTLASLVGSNLIGNVPFVILLLEIAPQMSPGALYGLALMSTLAGNLLIIGSVVNLIVAESARGQGVRLTFMDFARTGAPITLLSMAVAGGWLLLGGWMAW